MGRRWPVMETMRLDDASNTSRRFKPTRTIRYASARKTGTKRFLSLSF